LVPTVNSGGEGQRVQFVDFRGGFPLGENKTAGLGCHQKTWTGDREGFPKVGRPTPKSPKKTQKSKTPINGGPAPQRKDLVIPWELETKKTARNPPSRGG